jgi:hypothetical protein
MTRRGVADDSGGQPQTRLVDKPVCGLALAAFPQPPLAAGAFIVVDYDDGFPTPQSERPYFEADNTAVLAQPCALAGLPHLGLANPCHRRGPLKRRASLA